jgi:hypothetical protein
VYQKISIHTLIMMKRHQRKTVEPQNRSYGHYPHGSNDPGTLRNIDSVSLRTFGPIAGTSPGFLTA